jgi:hypothetical protein
MRRIQPKDAENLSQWRKGTLAKGYAGLVSLLAKAIRQCWLEAAEKELNYPDFVIRIGAKQQEEWAGPPIRLVGGYSVKDQKQRWGRA